MTEDAGFLGEVTMKKKINKIELLAEELIDLYPELAMDVLGYTSKLGRILGWHYLLDIIWILKELECPPGGTILDAGGGNGMMQFILALKGYKVISVDMNQRNIPGFTENIFKMKEWDSNLNIEHPYLEYHQMSGTSSITSSSSHRNVEDFDFSNLPQIVYYHSNLNRLEKLEDNTIDAVVSVSALEHNPPDELEPVITELQRVLKVKGTMFITVSAAKESNFHKPSYSWVMDETDLKQYFQIEENCITNFSRYDEIFSALCKSKRLSHWLTGHYYRSDKNGMPWGKWDPQYQPVGIVKTNNKSNEKM